MWLIEDDGDAATVMEAALVRSYEGLKFLSYRGASGTSGSYWLHENNTKVVYSPHLVLL